MSDSPSAIAAAYSMIRALRAARPRPAGHGSVDHGDLGEVLDALRHGGLKELATRRDLIGAYRQRLESIDPNGLSKPEALAFWLNLYNAGALDLAAESHVGGQLSVLRIPGAFSRPWTTVAGENLSLSDIEHGKIRRFGDPRIHGALVCGAASCPTLRLTPYTGDDLDGQLESQMRSFMAEGGAVTVGERLMVSRIFLWYGTDFVRPSRMPSMVPVSRRAVRRAISPWLDPSSEGLPMSFQPYDWGLGCSIG